MQKHKNKFEKSNISGMILCGGAARRVGGVDKGLLSAKGERNRILIEHQINFLTPQVSHLSISANRNLNLYRSYGFPVYPDNSGAKFDGPLWGILNGLKNCQTDWLYVQPIDTPNLPSDTIKQLMKEVVNHRAKAYYLVTDRRAHYLHLFLNSSCYGSMLNYLQRGEKRAKTYLEEVNAKAINLGWKEAAFKNLNDIEDYHLKP